MLFEQDIMLSERDIKLFGRDIKLLYNLIMSFEQDDNCANKILSRSNNIFSRRNKLKNKTCMSLPGFRRLPVLLPLF